MIMLSIALVFDLIIRSLIILIASFISIVPISVFLLRSMTSLIVWLICYWYCSSWIKDISYGM